MCIQCTPCYRRGPQAGILLTLKLAALLLLIAVLPGCRSGHDVAPAPPGAYLVVLNKDDATLAVVQTTTGWTRDLAPTGQGPHEVAAADDGSIAVASNYGGEEPGHTLSVFGFRERRVVDTIDLAPHTRPHGIAFLDHRTTVLVTSETSHAVLEVDVPGRRIVRSLDTGADGSHMLALSPDRQLVYTANVGSGSVSLIDLRAGKLLKTAPAGKGTEAIALAPDGRELWVGNRAEDTLTVLDATTLDERARIPCAKMPIRLAFTPDGSRVLASCAASDEVRVFDAKSRQGLRAIPIQNGPAASTPVGLLAEPGGGFVFVACTAARKVAVIDLSTWSVTGSIDTGNGPDGLAWASGFGTIRR